jgi:parvulin-like peptidyl-prolyl isomerase
MTSAPYQDVALPPEVLRELRRHNLLRPLIERRVLAGALTAVAIPEELAQAALAQYCHQHGLQDEAALQRHLALQGLGPDDLRWQAELPLRLQRHAEACFRHKAEAHFLSRKNQLDRVVYSLLRVRDGFLARELYLQLEAGEADFAELAAAHSEGPEQQTRGIVGPVPLTQAHPQLSERLRTTQVGTLMEPFQIAEWWLVARLESYAPAVFDDAMAEQMARELLEQWVQEETLRILGELTAPAALTPLLSSPA